MVTFQMHSWASAAPSVITFLARPTSSMQISPSRGCRSLPEMGRGLPYLWPSPAPPLPQEGRKWVRSSGRWAKPATERPGGEPDRERDPPPPPTATSLSPSLPGPPSVCPLGLHLGSDCGDGLRVRPSLHPWGCCPQFLAGRVGAGPIPEESPAGSSRGTSAGRGECRVSSPQGGHHQWAANVFMPEDDQAWALWVKAGGRKRSLEETLGLPEGGNCPRGLEKLQEGLEGWGP